MGVAGVISVDQNFKITMDNILIAYFVRKSHASSFSKRVADDIAAALLEKGRASVEYAMTPVESYPVDNPAEFDQIVRLEKTNHLRPALTHRVGRWNDYKTIIIVAPNWDGDYPMGVYSFLDDYDFSGRRIIPVVVHNGDEGKTIRQEVREYMSEADVFDGVDIPQGSAVDPQAVAKVVATAIG